MGSTADRLSTIMVAIRVGLRCFHALLRIRRQPLNTQQLPARISVAQLRAEGLQHWPNAPGIYFADDRNLHCRRCVNDPETRAQIVQRRSDHDQILVLYATPSEDALIDDNCSTHHRHNKPARHSQSPNRGLLLRSNRSNPASGGRHL